MGKTAFIDPAAVDAWDLWFRWREGTRLRDLTVDDTWDRVARAISHVKNIDAGVWAQRYADAFSKWQLLPGERLLREAGTVMRAPPAMQPQPTGSGRNRWGLNTAALNAAAFLRQSRGSSARFDREEFVSVCALAVRFLDDALLTAGSDAPGLRIGVFGIAEALSALGVGYSGEAARAQAREIAIALAEGCLRGDSILARERGARAVDGKRWGTRMRSRGFGSELLADVRRYGMRHPRLTAIASQPRVALFANNVADGLDPATRTDTRARPATIRWQDPVLHQQPTLSAQTAQLELRAAMQTWIDRPIDTPLLALDDPDDHVREHCVALAGRLGLKPPRWRLTSC